MINSCCVIIFIIHSNMKYNILFNINNNSGGHRRYSSTTTRLRSLF